MKMKAVVYRKYGSPDVLELTEVPKPKPKADEVLVKIHATTVTAGDWRMRKASPFLARLYNGLFRPVKVKILGFELSGIIEEVGEDVKRLKVGDAIFAPCGIKFGAYAEYKCLKESKNIEIIPSNISFDEVAAVPIGGITALNFLQEVNISQGEKILIYGASGSVGTFAVQLAKHFGAEVTGVCSTQNIDLVKSLGAKFVIDYTQEDFTKTDGKYNVVFDAVGKISKAKARKILKKHGRYISVLGSTAKSNNNELSNLKTLIEEGKLKVVIDRKYPLEQIRDAHRYVEGWHKKGNVVINMV